jgi:hypothetical protein
MCDGDGRGEGVTNKVAGHKCEMRGYPYAIQYAESRYKSKSVITDRSVG